MVHVTIIMVNRVFIVRPQYLLYFIYSMLSAIQQNGYIFKYGLITDSASQNFFLYFISTRTI